jgi:hypothetical protein
MPGVAHKTFRGVVADGAGVTRPHLPSQIAWGHWPLQECFQKLYERSQESGTAQRNLHGRTCKVTYFCATNQFRERLECNVYRVMCVVGRSSWTGISPSLGLHLDITHKKMQVDKHCFCCLSGQRCCVTPQVANVTTRSTRWEDESFTS